MNKADQKIIEKNPGVVPHDLWVKFGLSEPGFNELVAQMDNAASKAQTYQKPRLIPQHILQPLIPELGYQGGSNGSSKVRIVPVKSGGLGTEIDRNQAEKMMRRQPGKYKIA